MKKVFAILTSVLLLAGCSTSSTAMDLSVSEFSTKVTEAGVITLDVRTPGEFNEGHIEGALLVDFQSGNFENAIESLDKKQTYAVYCRSGSRSGQAVKVMSEAGFTKLYNLDGGVIEWAGAGFPLVNN